MADSAPVAAPTNQATNFIDVLLDFLIKGLGAKAAIAAAVSAAPWLGIWGINGIFTWLVNLFAARFDDALKKNINVLVIRFQYTEQKVAYDQAIATITKPGATDAEIESGFSDIDKLISASK